MNIRASTIPVRSRAAPGRSRSGGASGSSAFWYAQTGGWAAYFLVHYAGAALDNDFAPWWASFASAAAGFVLTSAMAPLLRQVRHRGPAVQVAAALGLALLFAVPYSAVSEQAYWMGQGMGWRPESLPAYLGSALWCGSILLTWAGVFFGLMYYNEAHAQQLKAAQALGEARQARLAVLRERLNPHFLFNALNGISTFVLENEKDRAATMLEQLCTLLRHSIDEEPAQQVMLAEELELADLYLKIQKTRFEHRLRVVWRVTEESRCVAVPPMILQPLLENAVRYGVQPDPAGATIVVASAVEDDRLTLTVDNTQRFPAVARGEGIGHRNIRERLAALYGSYASFDVGRGRDNYRAVIGLPAGSPP